jgi:hypothetical protein
MEAIILAVCDYLEQIHGNEANCARQGSSHSLMDAVITRAIQIVVLDDSRHHSTSAGVSREILASTVSWAIYGAAREWFYTAKRKPAEKIVPSLGRLILPLLDKEPRSSPSQSRTGRSSGLSARVTRPLL